MKICILAPEFIPLWGGVGAYIIELVRHLPKKNEIHIITPYRKPIENIVSGQNNDDNVSLGKNITIHYLSSANDTFFYNAHFQFACFKKLPRLIREERFDMIHSHTAQMPDLYLQYRDIGIPTVTTIHSTIKGQFIGIKKAALEFCNKEKSEKFTNLFYPILALAERAYFNNNRYYISVSNWMKTQVLRDFPNLNRNNIFYCPNSVDIDQYSPRLKTTDKKIVLFVGRLVSFKGITSLIQAMPKIIVQHPDALFVFIGPGDFKPYSKMLHNLRIAEKNYVFIGHRNKSELIPFFQNASVLVIPSFYENLPTTMLEAMACGVPCVASNVGAIPEVITDGYNGLLVNPGSIDHLSISVCKILHDMNERKSIGLAARETICDKYDWKKNALKINNLYEAIISKNSE